MSSQENTTKIEISKYPIKENSSQNMPPNNTDGFLF